jgi:hypothetical protein
MKMWATTNEDERDKSHRNKKLVGRVRKLLKSVVERRRFRSGEKTKNCAFETEGEIIAKNEY